MSKRELVSKDIVISHGNEEDYKKLNNTANIEEDYFDSRSFNFSKNYNFANNNEKRLFINNNEENGIGHEKLNENIMEINKHNLPTRGFASIIEKQIFCNIRFLILDRDDIDSDNKLL
jgi:hypothetical protein